MQAPLFQLGRPHLPDCEQASTAGQAEWNEQEGPSVLPPLHPDRMLGAGKSAVTERDMVLSQACPCTSLYQRVQGLHLPHPSFPCPGRMGDGGVAARLKGKEKHQA